MMAYELCAGLRVCPFCLSDDSISFLAVDELNAAPEEMADIALAKDSNGVVLASVKDSKAYLLHVGKQCHEGDHAGGGNGRSDVNHHSDHRRHLDSRERRDSHYRYCRLSSDDSDSPRHGRRLSSDSRGGFHRCCSLDFRGSSC